MKNNIIIFTGGTGGHVIPAEILYDFINKKTNKVYLITDERGYQYLNNIFPKRIFKIKSSHMSGSYKYRIVAITKLIIGFFQSLLIILKLRPKIVISFGSYASLPPLLSLIILKKLLKTRLYIHEQNSVIGQTNKLFINFSNKFFLNFKKEYNLKNKYIKKISIVGLPNKSVVENKILNKKFHNNKIGFLIYAGSQGSLEILNVLKNLINNDTFKKINKQIKFIIQAPPAKHQEIEKIMNKNNYEYEIRPFFHNFHEVLNRSHIALSRSGAGTINDLILAKIPSVILPLSHAKNNHQYENAKVLTDIGCAKIIDSNLKNLHDISLFIKQVIDDKNFYESLINKFNKIKLYDTCELMWNTIVNEEKK
tara:strand:+ start:8389 stop:9486 length:1098 start_codon:yes stop_codon:yes gene_type:complete